MPQIRLENLIKRYGEIQVLHGIDLTMAENEFTVLVARLHMFAIPCWLRMASLLRTSQIMGPPIKPIAQSKAALGAKIGADFSK